MAVPKTELRTNGESVTIDCYGHKIWFPSHACDAVRFALSKHEFAIRDLPGDLDAEGKLTLVRRLIREGLIVILTA
jgi:hypothetical protein